MNRALNQLVPYLSPRRALQKSSLAESLWIKARRVRAPEGRTWKDKILDYEIETRPSSRHPSQNGMSAWKDKILDYEIETTLQHCPCPRYSETWKDKILDYEIETRNYEVLCDTCHRRLKR